MISWIKKILGDRKVSMVATADHVELTPTHLVMGLLIGWHNGTDNPISIQEIQVRVDMRGRNDEPLRFYPLECFARVIGRRAIQKTPIKPFTLPVNETHTEQIRFISQEVLDIPPGNYTVEIQIQDTSETSYTNQTKIQVPSKIKYRRSEEWQEE